MSIKLAPILRGSLTLIFVALVASSGRGEDNLKFGQPACPGRILNKEVFVICHNSQTKIPDWVGYALTSEDLDGPARRTNNFRPDPELSAGERAELADYRGSGYDRGHMAPAADFVRSREAMSSSFLLSNMAPQTSGLNSGRWAQLESAVRKRASQCDMWIFTGPIFIGGDPIDELGANSVAVPTHFFKVVLCINTDESKEMFASVMPNIRRLQTGIDTYATSVDNVEELTTLDFFGTLPVSEQEILESQENLLQ